MVMKEEKRRIRLLRKGQKGFWRLVFSRVWIMGFFIILQFLLLLTTFQWLEDYETLFQMISFVLVFGAVLYLFNSQMEATAKMTWLLLIMPFPIFGSAMLFYSKADIGYRGLKRRINALEKEGLRYLKQKSEVEMELRETHSTTYNLVKYFRRSDGYYPVYKNTRLTYFPTGEAKFEEMKKQLLKAKKYIFLEYFIIAEGKMWGEILAILRQKVQEGVEVRVLYDGMNEFSTLSFDYAERLRKLGIKAKSFAPLSPFLSTYYNYRDHRKILVIDNEVAFTGGVNLADEYINHINRFGHWKDTAIMLQGESVQTFTVLFIQMWSTLEREVDYTSYLIEPAKSYASDGFIIPFGDSPMDQDKVAENVYIDILNHARDYVYIMTPYLILDSALEHAICFAAERGVDVRIIMPGIPDKPIPYALAKTYYQRLMLSGVKIYEYTPGFIHAKVFLSDNSKAVVGTINLDYRSLYHHFECGAYIYRSSVLTDISKDFIDTFNQSKLVTLSEIENRSLSSKMIGSLARMVAPLL
ncbi:MULTISPECIES: cardiolipin synthase [Streptococcus]|uniref:Cardiolipin synthase n=1 Tax=Streptococcus caledonicus TaxID=2614158 RepID=A0ABW0UHW8_9STRE|nr:cardiolipin synthase [Streptococcus sp. S784/96/1]